MSIPVSINGVIVNDGVYGVESYGHHKDGEWVPNRLVSDLNARAKKAEKEVEVLHRIREKGYAENKRLHEENMKMEDRVAELEAEVERLHQDKIKLLRMMIHAKRFDYPLTEMSEILENLEDLQ